MVELSDAKSGAANKEPDEGKCGDVDLGELGSSIGDEDARL
jgi:hypothetical protein